MLLVITATMLKASSLISVHGASILDRLRSDDSVKTIVERDDTSIYSFRWTLNGAVV